MYDLLIQNTMIIDGTGKPAFPGSVAAGNGVIRLLPARTDAEALRVIDGTGRYVCPGFIDSHSHGDIPLGLDFASFSKISQGITTQVAGMCGFSMFPVNPDNLGMFQDSLGLFLDSFPEEMPAFTTCERYLRYADHVKKPENTRFLVGHVSLRAAAMGYDNRKPTAGELARMKEMLREAMEHGAGGFSSGLIYIPSAYADTDELTELCKVAAEYDGLYTTHLRNESTAALASVAEAIDVTRRSGVRTLISHHKIGGRQCWGDSQKTIDMIEAANEEGLSVSCDQYPYTASMTHLSVCAPPKYYSGGLAGMVEHLKNPRTRARIREEMNDPDTPYDNYYLNAGGWEGVFLSKSPKLPEAEKMTIAEYAAKTGQDPFDAFCEIMIANHGVASAIYFCMCDEDLFRIIRYKNTVVGTDGIIRSASDQAHPRAYGTFPHAIRVFVKEHHLFSLEEMIRKMTSLTAEIAGIPNKGTLKDGWDADLLVLDYDHLLDRADYVRPNLPCEGIDQVIVGGQVVYEDKKLTGATPGRVLRLHG